MAHSEPDLQTIVDRFAEATQPFDLAISLGITEVLCQPAPVTTALLPKVSIAGTELKVVDHVRYLGRFISSYATTFKEIAGRISKVSQSFGRLRS